MCLVITMAIHCCSTVTKPQILASAVPNNSTPSLNSPHNIKPHTISTTNNSSPQKIQLEKSELQQDKKKLKRGNRPSVLEIERAIGAGIFRDTDGQAFEVDGRSRLFDNMLGKTVGKNEGSVEKKLRETGEWLVDQTERTSRSAGKQILITLFVWILPMWIVAFLVVSGVIQLPFTTPFLEDIIS